MIHIKRYNAELKQVWDDFIETSKNGYFLFCRDYMDYHSDRYLDYSLLFYNENNQLLAIMPANIKDDHVYSHGGLTYGGIISDTSMKAAIMIELFEHLLLLLKEEKIKKLLYKAIPYIYHKFPSDEDLYAIFVNNGKLIRRDASSAIFLFNKIKVSQLRLRGIKKAKINNLAVKTSNDFASFFEIVQQVLWSKYKLKPVHTHQEIELLSNKFPQNIKLFAAYDGDKMLAGVLVFESEVVAHCQYMANSAEGKELGALDLVIDHLISEYSGMKRYFSFGVSTENNGTFLNEGLINQKETFGARTIVHDFYELAIN